MSGPPRSAPSVPSVALFVVDGHELQDFELAGAVRRGHRDFIAFFLVQELAADRRRGGNKALLRVGVFRHDELVLEFVFVLTDGDARAETGLAVRNAVDVHERDLAHAALQHGNAGVDVGLAFLRGLIFGVLAQVAQLAGALDLLGELHVQLALERVDLVFESLDEFFFHRLKLRSLTYRNSISRPASGGMVISVITSRQRRPAPPPAGRLTTW